MAMVETEGQHSAGLIVGQGLTGHKARFSNVDINVEQGGLAVVVGPGCSGRTTLLLALAGRYKLSAGRLTVGGWPAERSSAEIRRLVAVARARTESDPALDVDPTLRVHELVMETPDAVSNRFGDALDLVGLDVSRSDLVQDLRPADRTLLTLALALADDPPVVVLDDLDAGATPQDLDRLWAALFRVRSAGTTVLVSSCTPPPFSMLDPERDTVVELTGVEPRIPRSPES